MNIIKLTQLTIEDVQQLLTAKTLSVTELTELFYNHCLKTEPIIKVWAYLEKLEQLQLLTRSLDSKFSTTTTSALIGVPYGCKDIINTKEMRTEAGSKTMRGNLPTDDATIIKKLKKTNAILFGKTTTTEFASGGGAPTTCNPWNIEHTPGGSSSGSAATVASGMSLFSLGTQTSGSVIRPAAYTGVTALKPSFGQISKYGIIPSSFSQDTVGIFTKNVKDLTTVYNEINGYDSKDYTTYTTKKHRLTIRKTNNYRIGVIRDEYFEATNEIMAVYYKAINLLEKIGFTCVHASMPPNLPDANEAHNIIVDAETDDYHKAKFYSRKNQYSTELRNDIELGLTYSASTYIQAQKIRRVYQQKLLTLLTTCDILVTPATPTTAPKGLEKTGSPIFNKPFTNAGVPVLTIPIGFSKKTKLPIGIQFITKLSEEQTLIDVGQAFQFASNFHLKQPDIKI